MEEKQQEKEKQESEQDELEAKHRKHKRIYLMLAFTAVILIVGLIFLILYLTVWRYERTTEDAYVHGNEVMLTPQVGGIVTSIHTEETLLVKEGQLLVELDTTDRKIAFEQSTAHLAETIRQVQQMFERLFQLIYELEIKEQKLIASEAIFVDRSNLVQFDAVSKESYIEAQTSFNAAAAALEETKVLLLEALTQVDGTSVKTHPLVKLAEEGVRGAYVNLARCQIHAPVTGIVAQRRVQVGETVTPQTPLMSVIPIDQMWVEANFKEIHLSKLQLGQPVSLYADAYGDKVTYRSQIIGIAAGTGAAFSVLPPQNATGNWIKIVQRVPVRCSVPVEMLERYPLRIGMTMHARVDITEQEGSRLPTLSKSGIRYKTSIFNDQERGVDGVIQTIFDQNLLFDISVTDEFENIRSRVQKMRERQ